MRVGIHQPNFVPWMPYFEKIAACDIFVILSHCQFTKNNYQNRFNSDGWNTMRVSKKTELIKDKRYLNAEQDWYKILDKFQSLEFMRDLCNASLLKMNVAIIKAICQRLGIETPIYLDFPTDKTGTERLVEICRHYNATEYLMGESGTNYMDTSLFKGIKLITHTNKDKRPICQIL